MGRFGPWLRRGAQVTGMVEGTELETTAHDRGGGPVTRQARIADQRGRVHSAVDTLPESQSPVAVRSQAHASSARAFLAILSRHPKTVGTSPPQARHGAAAGTIFAPNPTRVSQVIEKVKQIGIVDFPDVGLMPARIPGDLDMAHQRQVGLDLLCQITPHDLAMIEVHLHKQIIAADSLYDLAGLCDGREKIARIVTGIEGLDE
jgi:hypothetical protein